MSQDAKFFQRGKIQVRVLPMRVFSPLRCTYSRTSVQEFRQELQAAETKDKKFTKRKTVLKKIVANITMGNDSSYCQRLMARSCSWGPTFTVSALFVDVVQCLGTPLLEIKKSASAFSIVVSV